MKVQRTKKGKLVARSKHTFNSALIGMLLGDGHLERFKFSRGPKNKSKKGPYWNRTVLRIGHALKQEEYLNWKIELIKAYVSDVSIYNKSKKIDNKIFYGKEAYLRHKKNFHFIYRKFYDGGTISTNNRLKGAIKRAKEKVLNRLNALSLAIWYMDDGSLYKYKRGDKHYATITLHTDNFSLEDVCLIRVKLKELFDLEFNVNHNGTTSKDKNYGYRLKCHKKESIEKFFNLVKVYVEDVKCMSYKLP